MAAADEKLGPEAQNDEKLLPTHDAAEKPPSPTSNSDDGALPPEKEDTVINLAEAEEKKKVDEGEKGGMGSYMVRFGSQVRGT